MTIEEFKEIAKKKASKASEAWGISNAMQKQAYELGYVQGCLMGGRIHVISSVEKSQFETR